MYKQGRYHGSLHYVFRAKLSQCLVTKKKPIAKTDTTIIHKHPPKKEKNRKERRLESYLTLKIIFVEENIQKETISMTSFLSSMYKWVGLDKFIFKNHDVVCNKNPSLIQINLCKHVHLLSKNILPFQELKKWSSFLYDVCSSGNRWLLIIRNLLVRR